MDLNPELLSAIDRLCVGLVVQCMFQCRVHNLNRRFAEKLTVWHEADPKCNVPLDFCLPGMWVFTNATKLSQSGMRSGSC